MAAPKSNEARLKPAWHSPSVQELGNLRDFVRAGTKTMINMDNGSVTLEQMIGD